MEIVKPGNFVKNSNNSEINKPKYRRYLLTCPKCKCQFIADSSEFMTGSRDMPSKYLFCPGCKHEIFTCNGRRIKETAQK